MELFLTEMRLFQNCSDFGATLMHGYDAVKPSEFLRLVYIQFIEMTRIGRLDVKPFSSNVLYCIFVYFKNMTDRTQPFTR